MHTRISETGLKNTDTANTSPAYRWQYEKLLEGCESNGRAALEAIYNHLLVANPSDWKSSEAYKRMNKTLIKSGSEFSAKYYLPQPHRTFYVLQPVMQEVEDLYISPSIGAAFLKELKNLTEPSVDETEALDLLCKALANLTIYKACTKLSVQVRPEGLTVLLAPAPDRQLDGQTTNDSSIAVLAKDCERDGNNYLNAAQALLNGKASTEKFTTYFQSVWYRKPGEKPSDPNDHMRGVYAL